jgi:hypothetical protein
MLLIDEHYVRPILRASSSARPSQQHIAIAHRDHVGGAAAYRIGVSVEVGGDSNTDL